MGPSEANLSGTGGCIFFSAEFEEKGRLQCIVEDVNVAKIWQVCVVQ